MQIHFSEGTRPCAGGRDVGDQPTASNGNYSARKEVCNAGKHPAMLAHRR